jgi:hypothetical protein
MEEALIKIRYLRVFFFACPGTTVAFPSRRCFRRVMWAGITRGME